MSEFATISGAGRSREDALSRTGASIGATKTAKFAPRIMIQSNSAPTEAMLQQFIGLSKAIDAMGSKISASNNPIQLAVEGVLKGSWDAVSRFWAGKMEDQIGLLAKANKGQKNHWTRQLYSGGNPRYTGSPAKSLFEFVPNTGRVAGMGVQVVIKRDIGASWSPIAETSRRHGRGKGLYDPWDHRGVFMLGAYEKGAFGKSNRNDKMKITGNRSKGDGKPMYIVAMGQNERGFIMSRHFETDYTAMKSQRDSDIKNITQGVTASKIMTNLDKSFRMGMKDALGKAAKEAYSLAAGIYRTYPKRHAVPPRAVRMSTFDVTGRKRNQGGAGAAEAALVFAKAFDKQINGRFKSGGVV